MKNSPTTTNSSVKWVAKIGSLVCAGRRAAKASSTRSVCKSLSLPVSKSTSWTGTRWMGRCSVAWACFLSTVFVSQPVFNVYCMHCISTRQAYGRRCGGLAWIGRGLIWRRFRPWLCMLGEYPGCGLVTFNRLSQALWSAWDMDRKDSVLHKRLP